MCFDVTVSPCCTIMYSKNAQQRDTLIVQYIMLKAHSSAHLLDAHPQQGYADVNCLGAQDVGALNIVNFPEAFHSVVSHFLP